MDMKAQGAVLRERRETLLLNRPELATEANISVSTIEKFEEGRLPLLAERSLALRRLQAALTRLEAQVTA